MKKLKIDKHIGEKSSEILDLILNKKQKTLLISAMKTGKTVFIFNYLQQQLYKLGIQLIVISPKVELIKDMTCKENLKEVREIISSDINFLDGKIEEEVKYMTFSNKGIFGKKSYVSLQDTVSIVTTPDSLYKTIRACEKKNKKYFIVYDENHEMISSYLWRKVLIRPFQAYENELCVGFLGLTATDTSLKLVNFDERIYVEVNEKFYQANETIIVNNFKYKKRAIAIAQFIDTIIEKYPNRKLHVKINNKDIITQNINILKKTHSKKKAFEWYREEEEEENQEGKKLREDLMKGIPRNDYDIIFMTSLIDVGVGLELDHKPIVIDFMDLKCDIDSDIIQFCGRYRNGIDKFYIVGNMAEEEREKYTPQEQLLKNITKSYQHMETLYNEIHYDKNLKVLGLTCTKDIENERYIYKTDEIAMKTLAYEQYINQFTQNPKNLEGYLKINKTFNTYEYSFLDCKTLFTEEDINSITDIEENEELLHRLKQEQEEFLNSKAELHDFIYDNLSNKDVEILITSPEELRHDKTRWDIMLKNFMRQYETFHSDEFIGVRVQNENLKGYNDKILNSKDILLLALKNKEKDITRKRKIIEYAIQKTNKVPTGNKPLCRKVYEMIDCFNAINNKPLPINFTEKIQSNFIEECSKKHNLKDMDSNKILKLFDEIYNTGQYKRLTSFNCSHKLYKYVKMYLEGKEPTRGKACKEVYELLDILNIKNRNFPISFNGEIKNNLSNYQLDKLVNKVFILNTETKIISIKTEKDTHLNKLIK